MVRRSCVVVAMLLVAPLLVGCSGSEEPSAPESTAGPTPLATLDVSEVHLARAEFCDRVPDSAVRDALGADPESDDGWTIGDPPPGGDAADPAHEFGCAWTTQDGRATRAWVFARPVSADFAATLVPKPGRRGGCEVLAPTAFGSPSYARACSAAGSTAAHRRAGLFGDTWLTCELSVPSSTPVGR